MSAKLNKQICSVISEKNFVKYKVKTLFLPFFSRAEDDAQAFI